MTDGTDKGLIAPHGGKLNAREVTGDAAKALAEKAKGLPLRQLNSRELADLELLANGGFSPLDGFMTKAAYERRRGRRCTCRTGLPWSIPVTLSASKEQANAFGKGEIALTDGDGTALAVMTVEEAFEYDKKDEAHKVFRDRGRGASGRRGAVRAGRAADRRAGAGVPAAGEPDVPGVPAGPGADARGVRGARLEARRRVPDAQPGAPRARVHPEGGARDLSTGCCCTRWSATRSRTTSRRTCGWSATGCCSTSTTRRTGRAVGAAGGDAVRGAARSDLPRDHAQELRLLALHRRAGPRRRRQLLRHVRRAAHLRRVRPAGAGHHAAVLRAHLLLQEVRGHGVEQDVPARPR